MSPRAAVVISLALGFSVGSLQAQNPKPTVEKIGDNLYQVGTLRVDRSAREVVVAGVLNDVTTVEFVATARNGAKSYESAITLDTDAITFNAALLLIGLDPARGRAPKMQFDSTAPVGDPVSIVVELSPDKRVPVEELLFDHGVKKVLAPGPWVYTGSTIVQTDQGPRFMAEADGVLIGLMRGPSAIIDSPRSDVVSRFGWVVLNPAIAKAGMRVSTIIKALPR